MGHFTGPVAKSSINSSLPFRDNKYQHDRNIPIFKLVRSILTPQKFPIQISTSPSPSGGTSCPSMCTFSPLRTRTGKGWFNALSLPGAFIKFVTLSFISSKARFKSSLRSEKMAWTSANSQRFPPQKNDSTRKSKAIMGNKKGRLPYFILKKQVKKRIYIYIYIRSKTMYIKIYYITSPLNKQLGFSQNPL